MLRGCPGNRKEASHMIQAALRHDLAKALSQAYKSGLDPLQLGCLE
jgi:hypothetical protein